LSKPFALNGIEPSATNSIWLSLLFLGLYALVPRGTIIELLLVCQQRHCFMHREFGTRPHGTTQTPVEMQVTCYRNPR